MSCLNALTIDVEDYYQVSAFESVVRFEEWPNYESRVERNTLRLLEMLARAGAGATFFILGWVAERHPRIVKEIQAAGHEVASHGYRHRLLYRMTRAEFRQDTSHAKAILEDLTGEPVRGFRAPSYSIVPATLACLDDLVELGFSYDSSIFPIHHDRYGMPGAPRFPHVIASGPGRGLVEFPLSTVRIGGVNLPVAGGGYFRILPYSLVRWGLHRINERERQPAVVYLHPWEIDPDQPRLNGASTSVFRHYVGLDRTQEKFRRLLADFTFGSLQAHVVGLRNGAGILGQPVPHDRGPAGA